jgi:hypothetical protein
LGGAADAVGEIDRDFHDGAARAVDATEEILLEGLALREIVPSSRSRTERRTARNPSDESWTGTPRIQQVKAQASPLET